MLWYDPCKTGWSFKKTYRRKLTKSNLKTRKLAFKSKTYKTLALPQTSLYVPSSWNLLILAPKQVTSNYVLYFYSTYYYFKILLPSYPYSWFFDNNTRVLNYQHRIQNGNFSFYSQLIQQLFTSFYTPFFNKLKIKGKGYYVYKNFRNTITHQLGHSHRTYIYSYFINVKFLSKTTILLLGLSKKDVFLVSSQVRQSKYINIFTGRGVRFAKQIIYKKTGKVSSYR